MLLVFAMLFSSGFCRRHASQIGWGAVKFDLSGTSEGQAGDVLYIENMTLNASFTDADIII